MTCTAVIGERAQRAAIYSTPWPCLVVDNFLEDSVLSDSIAEVCDTHSFEIERRGESQIEYALLKSRALWEALYSSSTICMLSAAFGVPLALSRDNWIQLRRMNSNSPEFPMHHDYVSTEDAVVSFLYLSADWAEEYGGRLHLFKSLDDEVPARSLSPIQNRLVAFQTKACHWHAVERVFGWERVCALALWDVDAG